MTLPCNPSDSAATGMACELPIVKSIWSELLVLEMLTGYVNECLLNIIEQFVYPVLSIVVAN